jgi:transcriptional regulator with XRE-family HTH domain
MYLMSKDAQRHWMNPEAKAIGEKIRRLRQEHRWRQLDLAKESNLTRTAIANYEQGVCFPTVPALRKLATVFRVSIDELVFDIARPESVLRDHKLLELFARVDRLNYRTKDIIQQVVEGLLGNQDYQNEHRSDQR